MNKQSMVISTLLVVVVLLLCKRSNPKKTKGLSKCHHCGESFRFYKVSCGLSEIITTYYYYYLYTAVA